VQEALLEVVADVVESKSPALLRRAALRCVEILDRMVPNEYWVDAPTGIYASTQVGDATDTSPYPDESDQLYLSTRRHIEHMTTLIDYVRAARGVR
jgi:hypothetical protein